MLASGPNRRLGPPFHPDPPQFGMQTKTGFIGKQQNPIKAFVFSKSVEFFLYAPRTRQPLPRWPGRNGKPVGVAKNPSAGSIAVPAAPSTSPVLSLQILHYGQPVPAIA